MKLVHLTDTHLVAAPALLYGLDPRARLTAAIENIKAKHSDAEAIVVTGDLCHWGEESAYRELAARLQELDMPVVLMMGNHDDRAAFRSVFPDAMDDGDGYVQGGRVTGGHRLLFLDTKQNGTHAGGYDAGRVSWLERALAVSSEPVLLFMHHPPFTIGISSMDALMQQDSDHLWTVLKPHAARIRHIFMGHVHRPVSGNWHGISFSILPGLSHQVMLRLDEHGHDIPGSHEAPAYAVLIVSDDSIVSHFDFFMDVSRQFSLDGHEAQGRDYALNFPAAT